MIEKRKNIYKNLAFFTILIFALLITVSGVSSATYDLTDGNTTAQFQGIIDNETDSDLTINLASGNYTFNQINVTRNATIIGQGPNTVITGTDGLLFNVTSSNVNIINLTIMDYDMGISSNATNLTIKNNNIETTDISISLIGNGANNPITGVVIEDNNIISHASGNSSSGVVYLSCLSSNITVFDVLFRGNTIAAPNSYLNGVFLGDSSREKRVSSATNFVFENNRITSIYNAVYLNAGPGNNNITITNNNITSTGTNSYGVYLSAVGSNNNITVTNNNITGKTYSVSLNVGSSSNITVTNNNLTATLQASRGLYLSTYNGNINITVTNNNLTGLEYGIYLISSNNNNITVTNNNLTGNYGMYLGAPNNENSSITLTNNNITGKTYGIYLEAYGGNNTNITFAENDIVGNVYGVSVRPGNKNV
jgi:hypothetical protein